MAIARTQKDGVVDLKIADRTELKDGIASSKSIESKSYSPDKKKKGFFQTTVEELRKAEWPSFGYVVRWSLIIVVFTIAISLFLGFVDNIFSSSIQFINCTSTEGEGKEIRECSNDLLRDITLQG